MAADDVVADPVLKPKAIDSISEYILNLDHIAIAVRDIEESVIWYQDKLGFSLVERRTTSGARTSMVSAVMRAGGAVVVLVQGLEPDCQVTRFIDTFGPGVQHIAFTVSDLDGALGAVRSAGGESDTGILADAGIRQTFLRRDHGSGVRVELIERRGGEFSDSSVERLFRAMEAGDIF